MFGQSAIFFYTSRPGQVLCTSIWARAITVEHIESELVNWPDLVSERIECMGWNSAGLCKYKADTI